MASRGHGEHSLNRTGTAGSPVLCRCFSARCPHVLAVATGVNHQCLYFGRGRSAPASPPLLQPCTRPPPLPFVIRGSLDASLTWSPTGPRGRIGLYCCNGGLDKAGMGLLKVTRFRRQRRQAAMPARSSWRQQHLGRAAACIPSPPAALAVGASQSAPPAPTTTGDT